MWRAVGTPMGCRILGGCGDTKGLWGPGDREFWGSQG